MSSLLKEKRGKFINNKYPNTYRSALDYLNKTNMRSKGVWVKNLELFMAGLLFNTDIWVHSKETGNSWNVFSGKCASVDIILNSPPANNNGSIYIVHAGNHYEPVLEISENIKPAVL